VVCVTLRDAERTYGKSVEFWEKSVDFLKKGVDFWEKVALQISLAATG
jgi:hypothetical protein